LVLARIHDRLLRALTKLYCFFRRALRCNLLPMLRENKLNAPGTAWRRTFTGLVPSAATGLAGAALRPELSTAGKSCARSPAGVAARGWRRFSKRTISRSGHQSSDYSAVAASERPAHRTRFGARPVPIWLTIESPRGLIDLFLISSISRPAGVHHLLPLRVPCSVLTDRVHRHCLGPVMNKSLSDSASNWVLLPTSVWNGMVGSYQATRDCMVTRQSSQLSLSRCRSARRSSQIATTHSFPETVAAPATFQQKLLAPADPICGLLPGLVLGLIRPTDGPCDGPPNSTGPPCPEK